MKPAVPKPQPCAIYTRKSSEHNLDLEFNSLDAQREACEAYIKSQAHEGWRLNPDRYDDGGLAGASLDCPSLQQLLADVRAGKITIVVVYKVDRLTRSLADFAKLVELFDEYGVSFVSITQTLPPAWAGLRSTCCSPLPSSSARSSAGGCATRLRPPSARASGLVDPCPSAIAVSTRSLKSCPKRQRRSGPFSPSIWSWAPWALCSRNSTGGASGPRSMGGGRPQERRDPV
jgi:hypothetical protein